MAQLQARHGPVTRTGSGTALMDPVAGSGLRSGRGGRYAAGAVATAAATISTLALLLGGSLDPGSARPSHPTATRSVEGSDDTPLPPPSAAPSPQSRAAPRTDTPDTPHVLATPAARDTSSRESRAQPESPAAQAVPAVDAGEHAGEPVADATPQQSPTQPPTRSPAQQPPESEQGPGDQERGLIDGLVGSLLGG